MICSRHGLAGFLRFDPVPMRAQIGFVQREDVAGAIRLLGRLDRLAESLGDIPSDLATDEALEAFERLIGAGSYRSDAMRQ